jgi:cohesin complex subunit SCC1
MFYSQLLLAKKGALGKVWLAAHYDRRLTKAQIANTDIKTLVASVEKPSAALSLRVSAHLLLGLSKIFQRQVMYLFVETNDALVKIRAVREAQRSGAQRSRACGAERGGWGCGRCGAASLPCPLPCLLGDLHAGPAAAARAVGMAQRAALP